MLNFEAIVEQYARKWTEEGPQDLLIEYSVQVVKNRIEDPKQAQRLFWKLACEDLTRRWGSKLRTESYDLDPRPKVEDYHRLLRSAAKTIAPLSAIRAWQIPIGAMEAEMRASWSVGQRVTAEDFRGRFRQLSDERLRPLEELAIHLATRTLPQPASSKQKFDLAAFAFLKTVSLQDFAKRLVRAGLVSPAEIKSSVVELPKNSKSALSLAQSLNSRARLTAFQAQAVIKGCDCPLVLGDYVVRDKIGEGGMGTVYRAEHRRMSRDVAVKLISVGTSDEQFVNRFLREVKVAGRLTHENIVRAYDAGEHRGKHYLVMEFVDGIDLASLIAQTGRLNPRTAVEYAIQIAKGLGYAHRQGVIHRDVKPDNVLLAEDGTLKVLDMGLARIEDTKSTRFTIGNNVFMGTAEYTAPEQAIDASSADARSDLYGLGCILHFLVCARPIYDGKSFAAQLLAHREAPIPQLAVHNPRAGGMLQGVFERMVAKQPSDRYASMEVVVTILERLLESDRRQKSRELLESDRRQKSRELLESDRRQKSQDRHPVAKNAVAVGTRPSGGPSRTKTPSTSDPSVEECSDDGGDRSPLSEDTEPAGQLQDTQIEQANEDVSDVQTSGRLRLIELQDIQIEQANEDVSDVRTSGRSRLIVFTLAMCLILPAIVATVGAVRYPAVTQTILDRVAKLFETGGRTDGGSQSPLRTPPPEQLKGPAEQFAKHIREGNVAVPAELRDIAENAFKNENCPKLAQLLASAILLEDDAMEERVRNREVAKTLDPDALIELATFGDLPDGYTSFLRGVVAWHQDNDELLAQQLQILQDESDSKNIRVGLGLRRGQWAARFLLIHATALSKVPDNELWILRFEENDFGSEEVGRAKWWVPSLEHSADKDLRLDLAFQQMLVAMASDAESKAYVFTNRLGEDSPLWDRINAAMIMEKESSFVPKKNDGQLYRAIFECATAAINREVATDSDEAREQMEALLKSAFAMSKLAEPDDETATLTVMRSAVKTLIDTRNGQFAMLTWSKSGWKISDKLEPDKFFVVSLLGQHCKWAISADPVSKILGELEMVAAMTGNWDDSARLEIRAEWFDYAERWARRSNDAGSPPNIPDAKQRANLYAAEANRLRATKQ